VEDVRDVIIVGGGPAGYTAALYTARANLHPLVIEGFNWGGQLMITSDVENYPGYADGVMGPTMMADFRRQAERFGAEFVTDDVTRVDFSERPFRVYVGDTEHRADSVIVATGASARQLGLPSEQTLQGRGVSYCATCDGAFFRDKVVVVVGGGDSAMEEATFLTRFARKVVIVHRRDEFRASPIMVDRARSNEKVEFILNAEVDEVLDEGNGHVSGLRLRDTVTGESTEIEADGLFVAVGHDPNTELFLDWLDHDEAGYLVTEPRSTYTNISGVFAAGDVSSALAASPAISSLACPSVIPARLTSTLTRAVAAAARADSAAAATSVSTLRLPITASASARSITIPATLITWAGGQAALASAWLMAAERAACSSAVDLGSR
jgi:thioredoxin reductase (NADPH)